MANILNPNNTNRTPVTYWANRIGRILSTIFDPHADKVLHPVPQVTGANSVTDMSFADASMSTIPDLWRTHMNRKSIYQDIDRMDNEDETVATGLDIIADCSISYNEPTPRVHSIELLAKDERVQKILTDLAQRIDLSDEVWQIARDAVKHGNEFREVVIDRQALKVIALKQTISYQIYPNVTEKGDKTPGWVMLKDGDIYGKNTGKELSEWQICMFQFGPRKGLFSIPPLTAARQNWVRLTKMEDGMAIARLTRAYDKMVHKIPVKEEMSREEVMSRIQMYKAAITKKRMIDSEGLLSQLDSPLDVQSDLYLPDTGDGRGSVTLLSANNAQLGNLNDINYLREKLLTRLQVPIAYLQINSAQKTHMASGSKKGDIEIQFARMLRRVQRMLKKGIRRVCDIELMLNGIAPTEELYEIKMTPINTKDLSEDADIQLTYAQAAVYFIEAFGALPASLIANKFMQLDTEQQGIMDTFLDKYADKITEARVKSIENGAIPKSDLTKDKLPGDNHSGSSAIPKQSIPLNTLVNLFHDLQEELFQDYRNNGLDIPEIDEDSQRTAIRTNLLAVANRTGADINIE